LIRKKNQPVKHDFRRSARNPGADSKQAGRLAPRYVGEQSGCLKN
jgi:hypothetical protein